MDRIAIRPIGGSLYIKLPSGYRYKYDIGPGVLFDLIPNADGSIIKLIKVDEEKPTASNAAVEQKAEVAAE